ncbi:MAG: ATP-binding cassette domain-containing protein [Prevotella sp.]|nr:ATP-binding cassette domain-containing protein [Prevotella sp.]
MLINYKNANIYHNDGDTVLREVNFHVEEGEFIYLIGRVGSGKSSLLRTIYMELNIDEADEATVLGFDLLTIRRKQIPELRRKMGIIFQDLQLLSDRSVYRNLYFVLKATGWRDKGDINRRIDEVLTQVGMTDKKDRMPHELSGGEQQRISIARALLNSPQLIVADEPTASLDSEASDAIIQLLRDISQRGTAVILTTHNRSLLNKYPGIVYRCNEQRLEEVTGDYNHIQLAEDELE